jgi:hypothetical protein
MPSRPDLLCAVAISSARGFHLAGAGKHSDRPVVANVTSPTVTADWLDESLMGAL